MEMFAIAISKLEKAALRLDVLVTITAVKTAEISVIPLEMQWRANAPRSYWGRVRDSLLVHSYRSTYVYFNSAFNTFTGERYLTIHRLGFNIFKLVSLDIDVAPLFAKFTFNNEPLPWYTFDSKLV
jgi:hypothetical protein